MKKYLILILSFLLIVASFVSCNEDDEDISSKYPEIFESSSVSESQTVLGEGKLVVNGEELDASFNIYQTHAELPLIPILNALDFDVAWLTDTEASVTYNGKVYTLNLSEKSLIEQGGSKNLIPQYGNDNYTCYVSEKTIILDDVSLYDVMIELNVPIRLSLNYDSMTVTINPK